MSTTIIRHSFNAPPFSFTDHISVSGPSTLYYLLVSSASATAGWIFLYDTAGFPADGTDPECPPIPIAVTPSEISINFMPDGRTIKNGIFAGFSTTLLTFTTGGLGEFCFEVGYYQGS